MPTLAQYLQKAQGNEVFADSLPVATSAEIDWQLIALFYAAVHYLEAYFATQQLHLRSHISRDNAIVRETRLEPLRIPYRHLKFLAYNARYEMIPFSAADVAEARAYLATIRSHILPLL